MTSRVLLVVLGSLAFAACSQGSSAVTPAGAALNQPAVPASVANPLKASVTSLSLTSATEAVGFTVSETGYTGALTPSGCSAYVRLSPKVGKGPTQRFAADVAKAGKCTLVVTDAKKHSVSIAVTATTTTGVIR